MDEQKTDKDLVDDFLSGNQIAFNLLAGRYKEKIYWHARRMTGNHQDADDVVQEVLIVMFRKLKDFRFDSALYTWIYKITNTRSINLINKRKVQRLVYLEPEHDTLQDGSSDVVRDIVNKEKLKKLDALLLKLPVKQREVFVLRNFEELSYEEIAGITGTSVAGLKANYFHAINKINEMMNHEE